MIKLVMAGAAGRMGKIILQLASQDKAFKIVGGIEQRGHAALGQDIGPLIGKDLMGVKVTQDAVAVLSQADVMIDFSHFSAIPENLKAAVQTHTAYVIGATGIPPVTIKQVKSASKKIPILQSPNMSIGVNLLFKLAALAGSILDKSYDLEITEIHHRMKKDAPSGTALKLLEIFAEVRGCTKKDVVYGRNGETGAREKGKIGVFALRGGDVVGDHTISFLGDGERVELIHRASSREAFARGALLAAKFLAKKKPGLYDMQQVLNMA
ncbi:MAG TPA: 4-hydroxy-tetrahydrodipicolinate reductase [Candidatus Omnitrophota bacterium]|nr:4-hydroxy-tetrahydrodipicolinate reductase [Candidatus Omnitrophota bacterium]